MVSFFETRSYWQGGSTDDERKYYKGYRLSQKGIYIETDKATGIIC